jgi:tRNA-specific 2-thiouridylase
MMQIKKSILNKKKKVLVGISGGVDSSVSALLLQKAGYEVEGVFAKVWQPDFVECTWRDEMKDAMRVCAQLEIPFHFLDLEQHYKKHVADYMISQYQAGRTPNPDVMCNTHIKFGFIYDFAMEKGFDYVATGHYSQNIDEQLHRGLDINKDQSYFLWNVSPEKFKHILFPIGHLKKDRVRALAEKYKLFTAEKKDSQGLCFIGPVDMKVFLKKLILTKPGKVQSLEGKEIGSHEGVELYTIGERHGFTIFPEYKQSNEKPFFIINKDIEKNLLVVDTKPLLVQKVILGETQLNSFTEKDQIEVQFRYRQEPIFAKLTQEQGQTVIIFEKPISTFIALGQSAVIYQARKCLGGGIVEKII